MIRTNGTNEQFVPFCHTLCPMLYPLILLASLCIWDKWDKKIKEYYKAYQKRKEKSVCKYSVPLSQINGKLNVINV